MVLKSVYVFLCLVFVNLCYCEYDFFLGTSRAILESKWRQKQIQIHESGIQKCLKDLFKYIDDLEDQKSWATYMNDAGANYIKPGELLKGSWGNWKLADYGNGYQKCLDLKYENITGSYCIINIFIKNYIKNLKPEIQKREHVTQMLNFIKNNEQNKTHRYYHQSGPIRLRLAACLPDSCSPEILNKLDILPENSEFAHCHTKEQLDEYRSLNFLDWNFIIFMSIIILLVLISTYRDLTGITKVQNGHANKILPAFSLVTNGKELLDPKSSSRSHIGCIAGIRTIALIIVTSLHLFYVDVYVPISNYKEKMETFDQPLRVSTMQVTLTVDTFYLLGGLLMAFSFLNTHSTTYGRNFSSIRHYIRRYFRLTPVIAVVLFYHLTLLKNTELAGEIQGVLWHEDPKGDGMLYPLVADCRNYCWAILTHLQNFLPFNLCMEHVWYVSTDFQLALISPIFLLFLAKKSDQRKNKIEVLSFVVTIVTIGSFLIHYTFGYNAIMMKNSSSDTYPLYYYCNTLAKSGPWLIGVLFGYVIFNAEKNGKFNEWIKNSLSNGIFWKICGLMASFCILGVNFLPNYVNPKQEGLPNFLHAFYAAIHRPIWSIMIGLIIYTSHIILPNGKLNKFLSNPIFQFGSKISFSMYIGHMIPAYIVKVSYVLDSVNFNTMTTIAMMIGILLVQIQIGIFLTLAIEMPFIKIEKILFPEKKITLANGENGTTKHQLNGHRNSNSIPVKNQNSEPINGKID